MPPGLIGSVVPMLWTFALKPCVSVVKLNAELAADDFRNIVSTFRTKYEFEDFKLRVD